MVFVDLFLKSIFIVVLLTAVFFVGIIAYFYMRVRRIARDMHRAAGTQHTGAGAQGRRRTQDTGRTGQGASSAHGTGGEQLYDERPEHDRQRKIFAKDEGEYVDFEEE